MPGRQGQLYRYALLAASAVAAAALAAQGLQRSAVVVGVSAFLALLVPVVLTRLLLRLELGLGSRASVDVELGLTQVSAAVCDVLVDPEGKLGELVAACLPLPVRLQKLHARKLGVTLRPFAGLLDITHDGMDFQVAMAHPDDWDCKAAEAEARSHALHLLEARLAALAAAGSPPPRRRLNQLLDAAIDCTRLCGDDFSLTLEAASRRGDDAAWRTPSAIQASLARMELAEAVIAVARESKPDMAPRSCRVMRVIDFALDIRPAAEAAAHSEPPDAPGIDGRPEDRRYKRGYTALLEPVPLSVVRLSIPRLLEGLLSERMGVLRRIDWEAFVDEAPSHVHLSREAACVFWGILGEYFSASAWQLELQTAEGSRGRPLSADEREVLAGLIRQAAHQSASQEQKQASEDALAELRYEDLLALRWYVASTGASSRLANAIRAPSPSADNATWAAEAAQLWQQSGKLYAEQAMFHELGIHMDVRETNTDIGSGAASIQCRGLRASLDLTEASTNFSLLTDTSMAIRAHAANRDVSSAVQKTLLLCERAAMREEFRHATGSTAHPVMEASLLRPTVGSMQIRLVLRQSNAWAHMPNWLQALLPEVSGLLDSDPVPPAPAARGLDEERESGTGRETEAKSPGMADEMAAKKELGFLAGWPLKLEFTNYDACLFLPQLAEDIDTARRGVALRATQVKALLTSGANPSVGGASAECLVFSIFGAAATVHTDEYILKPMDELKIFYEAFWHEVQGGWLQRLDVKSPFAQLQIMPQAMIVGSDAVDVLSEGLAAAGQSAEATAPGAAEPMVRQSSRGSEASYVTTASAAEDYADVMGRQLAMERESSQHLVKQIHAFCKSIGVDSSGNLEQSQAFQVVESLCVGQHALTHQELKSEFEKFWMAAQATGNGTVAFQEFCNAIGSYVAHAARRTCGMLAIRAGDLCSTEIPAFIGANDEEIWPHFAQDFRACQSQDDSADEASNALTLQWKLLRLLKNFSEARYWWNVLLGSRRQGEESPSHPWAIPEDAIFHPAGGVLVSAFAGRFQKVAFVESNEFEGDVHVADAPQRHGYELSVTLAGFKLGLADAMSWLRQQDRLFFAVGSHTQSSERAALAGHVALWRQDGGPVLIGEDDVLEAEFSLDELHGSCTNPFEKKEVGFVERWGVRAKALSEAGNPAVMLQLVSGQHLVFNLSSSLVFDVKPLLQALYLQWLPETAFRRGTTSSAETTWATAPLDYLLRRVGSLSREHLAGHGLLIPGGVGVPERGEVLWKGKTEVLHSGSFLSSVCFQFQLSVHDALSRVMLEGMEVEHVEFKESGIYQVTTRQSLGRPALDATQSIQIYTVDRCIDTPSLDDDPAPEFIRDQSGVKISKELGLWNCCGRGAKFWFEDRETTRIFGSAEHLEDGCSTTSEVPEADCVLCLQVDQSSMVMRPDFMVAGQWAMLLHENNIPKDRPLHRMTHRLGNLLSDDKSSDAMPSEALCLCTELVVNKHGCALLQILPPVELRNATQHILHVELKRPSGDLSKKVTLRPGEVLPVPLTALKGPSWAVRSTGAVSHAFMLSKPILEVGKKQSAVRRVLGLALESHALAAAEYQSEVGSAINSGRQARRYTLLMLPELRVVNSLPVRLTATVSHGQSSLEGTLFPPDERELLPGGSADFSLMGLDFRLQLSTGTVGVRSMSDGLSNSSSILVTSDHMNSNKRFPELSRDVQLGHYECSIQCSWAAGAAPEVIVYGKCVVFNKTGLPLMVRSTGELGPGPQQTIDGLAILTASEHQIQVSIKDVVPSQPDAEMPTHEGSLQHRCINRTQDSVFTWVDCHALVSQGKFSLKSDDEPFLEWELSDLSTARVIEVYRAGGDAHAFALEDPKRSHSIVLKAASEEDLNAWLKVFKNTIEAWRVVAATQKMTGVWNSEEGGQCRRCEVPEAACGAWSKAIPVQAPVDGETAIEVALDGDYKDEATTYGIGGSMLDLWSGPVDEDINPPRPSSYKWLFFGVQVQPLVGALGCSRGVTFTPRFIVQNRTSAFLQVLPAILSPRSRDWPKPVHAVLARTLLENHKSHWARSHQANLLDQTTSLEEGAVWVPPGESAAMFHFPLRCDPRDAAIGNKAVSLRLEGKPPLQVIEVESGSVLELERVSSSFMPYTDQFWHFGRLPQVLRGAVQSGRVRCMVASSSSAQGLGELALTATAEVFVAVHAQEELAEWLQSAPWEALHECLELQDKGECVATLHLFRRQVVAGGHICVDGAGPGAVLLFKAATALQGMASAAELSDDSRGLPWSDWVQLETTGEELHELQGEDEGDNGNNARFVRCSVQVKASTAFLVLSDEPAPYRVENWSLSRTLTIGFSSQSGGLRERRVLPPLSWIAFSWPVIHMKRQNARELVVHDVVTQKSECIEIDDIGPGTPLALNPDEEQMLTGSSAPLSEFGFRSVILQNDPQEMADYMSRLCKELGGQARARDVTALARQCLAKSASQSLRACCNALVTQDLVPRPLLSSQDLTEEGCRKAGLCDVFMADFLRTLLGSVGLSAKSLSEVRNCAAWCCSHHARLHRVMDEALGRIGMRALLDRDAAFEFAARSCNQVVLEFFLRHLLHDHGCSGNHARISSAASVIIEEHEDSGSLPLLSNVLADLQPDGVDNSVPSRQPDPLSAARSDCVSEENYAKVFVLGHVAALELFVRRMIVEQEGVLLDVGSLHVFCESLLQEESGWSLDRLRQELELQEWVYFGQRGGTRLSIDRWYDGATKVLSLTDSEQVCQYWQKRCSLDAKQGQGRQSRFSLGDLAVCDVDVQLAGFHLCLLYDPKVHALGTGVDADDADNAKMDEVMVITADHFRLRKQFQSLKVDLSLHHFQIDNLRERDQLNPIVLAPLDSGFHVDRREPPQKGEFRKLQSFIVTTVEIVPSSILHFRELIFIMQPVVMRLDAAYWMDLVLLLFEWFPSISDASETQSTVTGQYIEELCTGYLEMPETCTSLQLVYFEHLHFGSVVADAEILVVTQQMWRDARAGGDVLEDVGENAAFNWSVRINFWWLSNFLHGPVIRGWKGLTRILSFIERGVSGLMQSIGGGVLSGVGHITPKFSFPDLLLTHEFGDMHPFISRLTRSYAKSGISQCWKVLGSTNILGDPIGLGTSVTGGVVQFFQKTSTEIAQGDLRGEGVKALAQGVVGGTFAHAGKFLGALGDTVDALVDTGAVGRSDARMPGSVDHLGDGIAVGISSFSVSVASGVKGVVMLPIQGFQSRGVAGLAGGAVRGVAGAVAKPISGLLHGAQHIAEGVDATTHLWDHAGRMQPRRPVRSLLPGGSVPPLVGIEFARRISICIDSLSLSSTVVHGATYKVELRCGDWKKSTFFGRLARSGVVFQEVHWLPVPAFLDSDLILEVKDKALSGHVSEVLFQAHMPCNSPEITLRLSELLRRPAGTISSYQTRHVAATPEWQPLACRWRPVEAVRVPLKPTTSAPESVDAALLLRFWPAWDPETVPPYQRYREVPAFDDADPPDAIPTARLPPPPCQGWLEKRSKGVLNHWSLKWVVVKEFEFLYWDDKTLYDGGYQPKVRFGLADKDCPFRFAPGNDPATCFAQVTSGKGDGDPAVEAVWRPARDKRLRRRAKYDSFRSRFEAFQLLHADKPEAASIASDQRSGIVSSRCSSEVDDEEESSPSKPGAHFNEWLRWTREHEESVDPGSPVSATLWLQAIIRHSIKD